MLMTIVGLLVVLWVLGLVVHIGGGLINLLLIAAGVVFLWNLIAGRHRV